MMNQQSMVEKGALDCSCWRNPIIVFSVFFSRLASHGTPRNEVDEELNGKRSLRVQVIIIVRKASKHLLKELYVRIWHWYLGSQKSNEKKRRKYPEYLFTPKGSSHSNWILTRLWLKLFYFNSMYLLLQRQQAICWLPQKHCFNLSQAGLKILLVFPRFLLNLSSLEMHIKVWKGLILQAVLMYQTYRIYRGKSDQYWNLLLY